MPARRLPSRRMNCTSLLLAKPEAPVFEAPLMPAAKAAQTGAALAGAMAPLARLIGLRCVHLHGRGLRLPAVRQLLEAIAAWAGECHAQLRPAPPRVDSARGTRWRWERRREALTPVFAGRIVLIGQGETPTGFSNGTLTVFLGDLPVSRERLAELLAPPAARAAICVNALRWKPSRADRLAPLALRGLDAEGRSTITGDTAAQSQMAHAYWHAQWASDAVRQGIGRTFPLALLPVRKDAERPLDDLALDLGTSTLFGEQTIATAVLQRLAAAGRLIFDPETNRFGLTSAETANDAERRALARLNEIGFYDRHVAGEPRRRLQVARVVPFQGGLPLSEVFARWSDLAREGRIDRAPRPLAGINSCFFLNFPEELQTPHAALNDAAAALVLGGMWQCPPLLRRATLLMGPGRVAMRVTSWDDVILETPLLARPLVPGRTAGARGVPVAVDEERRPRGGAQIFTPWSVARSASGQITLRGFEPGRDRAFIVVGTEIVEESRAAAITIPHSGYVLVLPGSLPGVADIPHPLPGALRRVAVRWRRAADRGFTEALPCGPSLLSAGKPLPHDHFDRCTAGKGSEQYLSWQARGGATVQRGVVPTRLPLDVTATRAPRTAVGLTARGEVVMVTVDGRADMRHSIGATLHELALLMKDLGCREALNFDGGGSTSLFLDHREARSQPLLPGLAPGLTNRPSDRGGVERVLPLPLLLWSK